MQDPKEVEKETTEQATKIAKDEVVKDGSVGDTKKEETKEEATVKEEKKYYQRLLEVQVPKNSPSHVDQVSQQD